ncbi:MAG: hypothetical protein U5L72_06380 [Bacteroidales bacterium]|nr:hypothetical protein [Bacteroidales bacterium]
MKNKSTKSPFPWTSVSVLLLSAAMLTAVILLYSSGQKERILHDAATEMEAVARLKAEQVAKWRSEKLNDARLIHENVTLVENVDAMFIKDRPQWEKSRLEQFLKTLIENYDFGGVVLVDAGGNPGLAVPASESTAGEFLRRNITASISNPVIFMTEFHAATVVSYLHLDLLIPMRMPHDGAPCWQVCWSDKDRSRKKNFSRCSPPGQPPEEHPECILFRFEGDSVVYLNGSRLAGFDRPVTFASGEMELSAINPPAEEAEARTYTDYTGTEVVASVKKVPGTQWYLTAKKETEEILERFTREITMLWGIMGLVYLALGKHRLSDYKVNQSPVPP